ncbi:MULTISPECIES: hypothetical protein [Kamptonema]|uniref:hypothetical protein n=1 Tax=Kamptonema TaxID=1501433 RepID=UPI0011D24364|nr:MULTISPECIES: hypothetical protein [Kamptonema]
MKSCGVVVCGVACVRVVKGNSGLTGANISIHIQYPRQRLNFALFQRYLETGYSATKFVPALAGKRYQSYLGRAART